MTTILIIDDDFLSLQLIREALPRWRMLVATDGELGLRLFYQYMSDVDIIVLDVHFPNAAMSGKEVYRAIRDLSDTVPIVLYSADEQVKEDIAPDDPGTCFLPKPTHIHDIVKILRSALSDTTITHRSQNSADHPDFYASLSESSIVPGAHVLDLMGRAQKHVADTVRRGRYKGPADVIDYLQRHQCVKDIDGELCPTAVGVLMFADEPERWLAASGLDFAQFGGSQEMLFHDQMRGPIPDIIERAIEMLWARTDHQYSTSIRREEEHAYPRPVLRELTVNALCHRDWSNLGALVRIQMYPDRIEWSNPGGLLPGVMLFPDAPRRSVARNPMLAQVLLHAGYVERFGIGMNTVFQTLHAGGYAAPEIRSDSDWFSITVRLASDTTTARNRKQVITQYVNAHGPVGIQAIERYLRSCGDSAARRTIQDDLQVLLSDGTIIASGATNTRVYSSPKK